MIDDNLLATLHAHADAIAFRMLGDPDLASAVALASAERIAGEIESTAGFPLAFLAADTVAGALAAAPSIGAGTELHDPLAEDRRRLRERLSVTPVAVRTVVALGCLCGYDADTTSALARRSPDDIRRTLEQANATVDAAALGRRSAVVAPPAPPEPPAAPTAPIVLAPAPLPPPAPLASPEPSTTGTPAHRRRGWRRRPRIRVSTAVAIALIAGSVWVVTHDGGERPSFADVPAPVALGGGGCQVSPNLPLGAAQDETIAVAGVTRQYVVHLPARFDPAERLPLLIDLGDFGELARDRQTASELGPLSDQQGFVLVTAQADGATAQWNVTSAKGRPDDVAFLRAIVEQLDKRLCIDPARISITGMGNGAQMAGAFVCQASDLVSAVVMVAGSATTQPCRVSERLAVLITVFDDDTVLPPTGGFGPGLQAALGPAQGVLAGGLPDPPSAEASVAAWAQAAGCGVEPDPPIAASPGAQQTAYTSCTDQSTVALIRTPETRAWTQSIASAAWAFVSSHPRG